jgi:hypothetical protein
MTQSFYQRHRELILIGLMLTGIVCIFDVITNNIILWPIRIPLIIIAVFAIVCFFREQTPEETKDLPK